MYSDKTPRLLKNVNTYKKKYKILKKSQSLITNKVDPLT